MKLMQPRVVVKNYICECYRAPDSRPVDNFIQGKTLYDITMVRLSDNIVKYHLKEVGW
jgi:hypothetical protein